MDYHRLFYWLLILILCQPYETSTFEIYGVDLARRLTKISKEGLGQEAIQTLFDEKAAFSTRVPNGDQIVKTLASTLGTRFNLYNDAIKNLHQAIVDEYHTFQTTNQTTTTECCKINISNTDLQYNSNFNIKVDADKVCFRRAQPSIEVGKVSPIIVEAMKDNFRQNPNLGWQYFGNEKGVLIIFPSAYTSNTKNSCTEYDPRVRPWYAQANAPIPKDIVIAMDDTGGDNSEVVKKAVEILLDTTNPNDRITVIKFGTNVRKYFGSSDNSPCFSSSLALATPQNIKSFKDFIQNQDSSGSEAQFRPVIGEAFKYFKTVDDDVERSKLLVFLAASNPTDVNSPSDLKNMIDGYKNIKVVIQTYTFGSEISDNTLESLRMIAESSAFKTSSGTLKHGTHTHIEGADQLRFQLHSYYNIFAESHTGGDPIVTVPYADFNSLGLVVSLCLPLHASGALKGVTCIDAKIDDIFFNVTYYQGGVDTYVFITDSHGRTILHPMLPKPRDWQADSIFIDISTLERSDQVVDIIASMKRGEAGNKTFYTRRQVHALGLDARSTGHQRIVSHYYWAKVPDTDYSLCVVFTDKDGEVDISMNTFPNSVNYLHPNVLIQKKEKDLCHNAETVATTGGSMVTFSGTAYNLLTEDVNPNGEQQRTRYDNFFKSNADDQAPEFKISTRSWVALSGLVDKIWRGDPSSQYSSVIPWRHLVTLSGVIRIYPGTLLMRYDPSLFSWFKMATLNQGRLLVRPIKKENFSLMISQSIFRGRPDGGHARTDVPVAVVGGELRVTYLYHLLQDIYPACREARCFIVDGSGYVLAHPKYTDKEKNVSHLITIEPTIGRYLRNSGHLQRTRCIDLEMYKIVLSWVLSLEDWVVSSTSPRFELHTVSGTNLMVGITWQEDDDTDTCNCEELTLCKGQTDDECQCPCFENLKFNFCNNTIGETLSSAQKAYPTCSLQTEVFDIVQQPPADTDLGLLDPCFSTLCHEVTSKSQCSIYSSCGWCQTEREGKESCNDVKNCLATTATNTSGNTTNIIIPIVIILLIIAIILLLLCVAWKCWPGSLKRLWSRIKGACLPGRGTPPSVAMEISPTVRDLPRAPARPPQNGTLGNSYVEDGPRRVGSTLDRARVPTPPPGGERVNPGFSPDGSIYDTVDHEEINVVGRGPPGGQSRTLPATSRVAGLGPGAGPGANGGPRGLRWGAGTMPSQQYLHPYPRHFSESDSRLPGSDSDSNAYSIASDPTPYPRPLAESSGFEGHSYKTPSHLVTYNRLQPSESPDGRREMRLSPVPPGGSGQFNRGPSPYQEMHGNQRSSPVPRKSNIPPLPSFPQDHPLYRASPPPDPRPHPGHPGGRYNQQYSGGDPPSVGGSLSQSEPEDLSFGKKSNSGQYPHPMQSHRNHPRDSPLANPEFHGQVEPEDLSRVSEPSNRPGFGYPQPYDLRDRNQNGSNNDRESRRYSETETHQPLPRDPIRSSNSQSRPPSEFKSMLYANSEAEERFPDYKDLRLSLDLEGPPGAHGEVPSSPNPAVVPQYEAQDSLSSAGQGAGAPEYPPPGPPPLDHPTDSGMFSEFGKPGSTTYPKHV